MWYDRWIELASPRIEGSIHLQRALRAKGVPVFALTNFGRYSFEEACRSWISCRSSTGAMFRG
jgi:2-haloacid dehalogenase